MKKLAILFGLIFTVSVICIFWAKPQSPLFFILLTIISCSFVVFTGAISFNWKEGFWKNLFMFPSDLFLLIIGFSTAFGYGTFKANSIVWGDWRKKNKTN